MTPELPPPPVTSYQLPAAVPTPFWGYQDLFFFLSLCFPTLVVAALWFADSPRSRRLENQLKVCSRN